MDFADNQQESEQQSAAAAEPRTVVGGKRPAPNFAAVRDRGVLNAGLDGLSLGYEKDHPGQKCRWARYEPNKDNGLDEVVLYEGMGYKLVEYDDLGESTATAKTRTGPVKRGDLVLMAAPTEVHNMIRLQDAQSAEADRVLPQTAFKENLAQTKVRRSDGEVDQAQMTGKVKITEEEVVVTPSNNEGGESK